jgi:hypothetical protein
MKTLFELDRYLIRRKILKIFGASFHTYDGQRVVGFTSQKAFKLKEDIRIYSDESQTTELLMIRARNMIDFAAAYDIVDGQTGEKVGAARRRGFRSLLRDSWELLDAGDGLIGELEEDSAGMAILRRFVSNLVPQTFHLNAPGQRGTVVFRQHFNPFVYKLDVSIPQSSTLDRRAIFGLAALVAAIEGRQD